MTHAFEIIRITIETLLSFAWFALPTYYAVREDIKGDVHPNHDNWYVFTFGIVTSGLYAWLMMTAYDYDLILMWFCCGLVSAAIYMFIFPYVINYVLIKRGIIERSFWWNHLNDKSWPDDWHFWRSLNWRYRMAISAILFILFCVPYFKLIV